jgi:biopolymer transport protein ExbB
VKCAAVRKHGACTVRATTKQAAIGPVADASGATVRRCLGLLAAALLASLSWEAPAQSNSAAADAQAAAAARAQAEAEAAAREREQLFATYVEQSRELAEREAEIAREREAEARAALQEQEQRAARAVERRDAAEARGTQLDQQWEQNEGRISELTTLLEQHQGNLGELFGVTRQVAGDATRVLSESVLTAQLPQEKGENRSDFVRRLAGAEALPSISELRRLWLELLQETKAGSEVIRFTAEVMPASTLPRPASDEVPGDGVPAEALGADALPADAAAADGQQPTGGDAHKREVVRVGTFTVVSDGEFLGFLPSLGKLTELEGWLPGVFRKLASDLQNAPPDGGYVPAVVDPASGSLLGVYLERPGFIQRIENGEVVGYVIIAVGILGMLAALFQYGYLIRAASRVRAQLRHIELPRPDNALGRVLLSVTGDRSTAGNPELTELQLSEAVLHEVPKLERCQGFLRLAVAAGPLLGLIGTVIGMIITFKAITASGSSDPKLMAHGIGQAMIATVLGLGIAIPLLFMNAFLAARSRRIVQILTEQSQALLAGVISATKGGAGAAGGASTAPASRR